jgi:hypothetical protein
MVTLVILKSKFIVRRRVSGNVVVEGTEDRAVLARLSRAQLQAYTMGEGNAVGTVTYSDINPADGSFQLGPLRPGRLTIVLGAADRNVTPEFALMAIDHNGVDKSQGFQIKEGESLSGVRLVAGYGTGTIRGTVRVEGGTLPAGTYMDAAFIRPGQFVDDRPHADGFTRAIRLRTCAAGKLRSRC